MPEYLRPDLYVEELPSQIQPIQGVGTTLASFVGVAAQGPIDDPQLLTGWPAFQRIFGDRFSTPSFGRSFLADAVFAFFQNGGQRCYVNRVVHRASGVIQAIPATLDLNDEQPSPVKAITVNAINEGAWGNHLYVGVKLNPRCSTTLSSSVLIGATVLPVASTYGLKPGSEIKIEGSTGTKRYAQVIFVQPGNPGLVQIAAPIGFPFASGATVVSDEFDLFVYKDGVIKETWKNLSVVSGYNNIPNPDYIERVNDDAFGSIYVNVVVNTADTTTYLRHPAQQIFGDGTPVPRILAGGDDGLTSFDDVDVIGDDSIPSGLQALTKIDGINMVALPGFNGATITDGLRTWVENYKYAFANTAAPIGSRSVTVQTYRQNTPGLESNRVALYHPWIWVADPLGAGKQPMVLVPPEGHIMGIDARTDINRGVFKTGAGIDAQVRGALDVEYLIDKPLEAVLNPLSINSIVKRRNLGIYVNGGRTTSAIPEYLYKSVMRTLIFLESSIDHSMNWAVWEPNNQALWTKLQLNLTAFLKARWDEGYLVGKTMKDAFYVICDETTNPQTTQNEGKVIAKVGVAIVKPAEFVIIQVSQWDGGHLIQELGLTG